MMNDVEGRIRTYIAETMLFSDNGYQYADNASFLEEGIVDSIGTMELVMFVEKHFAVIVEDEELVPDNFDSVSRVATHIRGKSSPVASAG